MTGGDPFAHGTPVGDYHSWVKPPPPDCPDCPCCTLARRRAQEHHTRCVVFVQSGADTMDVSNCPCSRGGGA
jgi:hypothetical protein